MGFLDLLGSFFRLLDRIFGSYQEHKIENRGRDAERAQAGKVVEERVERAEQAVANPDDAVVEQLRSRFDRSRKVSGDQ